MSEAIQCTNPEERSFCPICHMSWNGSVSTCPACGNEYGIACHTSINEARAALAFMRGIDCSECAEDKPHCLTCKVGVKRAEDDSGIRSPKYCASFKHV